MMNLKKELRGMGVAIITPFDEKGRVDFLSLEKLLVHLLEGGVDYLVLLGTTAESATLDIEEKKDIIQFCQEKNYKNVPIVIGIGGNDTKMVEQQFAKLPVEKSLAIMTVSPYYSRPSQEGIFQHYSYLASVSPKPIIVYNVPSRTGKNIDAHTVVRLAHEVPKIQGIKEASPTIDNAILLMKDCPKNFLLASGEDSLALPLILMGFDGLISVAANVFPSSVKKIVNAALVKKNVEANASYFEIYDAIQLMFAENNPAGVKAFLSNIGIIKNNLRLPLVPVSPGLSEKIAMEVKKLSKI